MAYTTINKSSDHFNTKLYTGNGSAGNSITGVGFQPDWVWIKNRGNTESHALFDAVRGVTKRIASNSTGAEETNANTVTAFGTDGFTVGTNAGVNGNGISTVAWNWKANGAGSANTDGSITTTATSVNTTSGFSISQYTGAGSTSTVGHGLGVAPKVVLIKGLSNSGSWGMYHSSIGATKKIILNSTAAEASSGWMNNTAPTSSVFTVINDADVGSSGYTYVAYSFAEKQGFSKFSSYVGNGSSDGTFVYTGFKPAFALVKRSDSSNNWNLYDNKREGFNGGDEPLFADLNNSESTDTGRIDFLSNGFKIRTTNSQVGASGGTYIYMAFAEAPLVGSNNVPCTAR
jgi:hypothetical protein